MPTEAMVELDEVEDGREDAEGLGAPRVSTI